MNTYLDFSAVKRLDEELRQEYELVEEAVFKGIVVHRQATGRRQ